MKRTIMCLGAVLIVLTSSAQDKTASVISAAGDISKSATIVLEWTVGEPAIETVSSSSGLLTQGFHQPVLEIKKNTAIKTLASGRNAAVIYPNPATALITIQLEKPSENPMIVSIADGSGKVLLRNNFPLNSTAVKINLAALAQGTYFLQLTNPDGSIQGAYKVIKVQ